ncbi:MAG: hypothetical protein AAB434_06920 [Planctomycetota bacterium]
MKLGFRVAAAVLLACATAAQACSSCAVPDSADGATSRGAYYGTAIFLTLLPVSLVLLLAWWIRRQGLGDGAAPSGSLDKAGA